VATRRFQWSGGKQTIEMSGVCFLLSAVAVKKTGKIVTLEKEAKFEAVKQFRKMLLALIIGCRHPLLEKLFRRKCFKLEKQSKTKWHSGD
jgi:hypothetical protein